MTIKNKINEMFNAETAEEQLHLQTFSEDDSEDEEE